MEKNFVLGRGLRALIPDKKAETKLQSQAQADIETDVKIQEILIQDILPNEFQPRQNFNDEKFNELKASIQEKGLMQPILVRAKGEKYEIIAGERRYRACKELKWVTIPVIVKEATDKESLELAIIENIQREDLNIIDKALSYKQLLTEFGLTQDELSRQLGIDRSSLANTVRVLLLPADIQTALKQEKISFGHAKVLLSITDPKEQLLQFQQILSQGLSVRGIERELKVKSMKNPKTKKENDPNILYLQETLQTKFGTKVIIEHNSKKNKGYLKIEYYSNDDLSRILDKIK